MKFSVSFSKITPLSSLIAALDSNKCQKDKAENWNKEDLFAVFIAIISHFFPPFSFKLEASNWETIFGTLESVFVYQGDGTYTCAHWRTFLIASCQGQRLHSAMCGMSEGLRLQRLQLTPESRAHCVAAEGEQRHFHRRNFGFLSIRRPALWARVVFICLCTVGMCGAPEACTFQTTSGGCINSHAWRNIKEGAKIPADDQDCQLERRVCLLGI